jgi:hypothetical protein
VGVDITGPDEPQSQQTKRTRRAEPITKRKAKNGLITYEFRADVGSKPDGTRLIGDGLPTELCLRRGANIVALQAKSLQAPTPGNLPSRSLRLVTSGWPAAAGSAA